MKSPSEDVVECCGTCFFHGESETGEVICKRFPPVLDPLWIRDNYVGNDKGIYGPDAFVLPVVNVGDWCGEFTLDPDAGQND